MTITMMTLNPADSTTVRYLYMLQLYANKCTFKRDVSVSGPHLQ